MEDAVESYKKTSRHANISHKMAEEQNKRYEEELERRNGVHQENIYRMGEEMKAVEKINKLEEQNKLYRQLLEEVIEEGSSFMVDLIADVLYSDDHNDRMSK